LEAVLAKVVGLVADCLIKRESMIVVYCLAKEQKEVGRLLILWGDGSQIDEAFQRWSDEDILEMSARSWRWRRHA